VRNDDQGPGAGAAGPVAAFDHDGDAAAAGSPPPAGSADWADKLRDIQSITDAVANPLLLAQGIRSLMGAPLLAEGTAIGVLHVGTSSPRAFTGDNLDLLQLAADRAAVAVQSGIQRRPDQFAGWGHGQVPIRTRPSEAGSRSAWVAPTLTPPLPHSHQPSSFAAQVPRARSSMETGRARQQQPASASTFPRQARTVEATAGTQKLLRPSHPPGPGSEPELPFGIAAPTPWREVPLMDSQANVALPVVVSAPAEIDATNANQLRATLLAADGSRPAVVVDMSQTVFCDAAGISALVQARNQAEADGVEMRLVITSASVFRVFALIGVDQLFPIFTSLPAALADKTRAPASTAELAAD
jgi:anti-anti-sigma factor